MSYSFYNICFKYILSKAQALLLTVPLPFYCVYFVQCRFSISFDNWKLLVQTLSVKRCILTLKIRREKQRQHNFLSGRLHQDKFEFSLFWMSQWASLPSSMCHVTASCKRPIVCSKAINHSLISHSRNNGEIGKNAGLWDCLGIRMGIAAMNKYTSNSQQFVVQGIQTTPDNSNPR